VLAPYLKAQTALVVECIEHEGIEVLDAVSLEISDNLEVGARDPRAPIEISRRLNTANCDAVVISACVQMPSLASVQPVQDRLGLPVVSSAVCTTWRMLKALNLPAMAPNAGALLSGRY
jgi:maleate isomerase